MKKQTLVIIEEQIMSGMFSYSELIGLLETIIEMSEEGDYFEEGSKADIFIKNLKKTVVEWKE